jgi:hypothetical protein
MVKVKGVSSPLLLFHQNKHININKNLVEEQFGFRLATSTDKASYRLINKILNAINVRWLEASSVTYRRHLLMLTIVKVKVKLSRNRPWRPIGL